MVGLLTTPTVKSAPPGRTCWVSFQSWISLSRTLERHVREKMIIWGVQPSIAPVANYLRMSSSLVSTKVIHVVRGASKRGGSVMDDRTSNAIDIYRKRQISYQYQSSLNIRSGFSVAILPLPSGTEYFSHAALCSLGTWANSSSNFSLVKPVKLRLWCFCWSSVMVSEKKVTWNRLKKGLRKEKTKGKRYDAKHEIFILDFLSTMWCVFDRRLLGWLAVRSLYPATLPDLELHFVHARNLGPIHKHKTFCLAAERVFSYNKNQLIIDGDHFSL